MRSVGSVFSGWRLILWLVAVCTASAQAGGEARIVTAAQVNGTWDSGNGTFKVLAFGQQKLKVEYSGFYEYHDSPSGPMVNTGEARGIAFIEGDTAIFRPEGASDEDCLITLKFQGKMLNVTQTGFCGFGLNVTADGTDRKVARTKPKFRDS